MAMSEPVVVLDLHRFVGPEPQQRSVDVIAERDAVGVHVARPREREDLEAARVREDRAVPTHEAVEAAEATDALGSRTYREVVGVSEHDVRARRADLHRCERFHGGGGADGHEGGRRCGTVGRPQPSRAGTTVVGFDVESERSRTRIFLEARHRGHGCGHRGATTAPG
jgi:hypothetical protein